MRHPQLGAKGLELIGRGLLEIVGADVSNIRPRNLIGNAYTASYHVSRSLSLGRHMDTWRRSDLVPPHGEDALAIKTPLIKPCRSCGIRSKKH